MICSLEISKSFDESFTIAIACVRPYSDLHHLDSIHIH